MGKSFGLASLIMRAAPCVSLAVVAAAVWAYYALYLDFSDAMGAGKRVLICGASMGIGEELVYQHAKRGASLVIVARSRDKLEAVADRARSLAPASTAVHVLTADLSDEASADLVVQHTVEKLGGIDTLILNHILTTG